MSQLAARILEYFYIPKILLTISKINPISLIIFKFVVVYLKAVKKLREFPLFFSNYYAKDCNVIKIEQIIMVNSK